MGSQKTSPGKASSFQGRRRYPKSILKKKDSTEQDILQEAKKLFFPNGESPKDKVSDFDIDLWDFLEKIVENSTSTNVREHNNADDDPVMRDIEYDIDAKAMK